jgi:peptidoglycan/LPS O-acetylase OafA/YrhL
LGGITGALAGFYFSDLFQPFLLYCGMYDLFFASILLGAALSKGFLSSALSLKPLVLLGEASYGIYILQAPVGDWFNLFLKILSGAVPGGLESAIPYPLSFFCYVTLLISLSLLTYFFLEKPLRVKIRRMDFGFYQEVLRRFLANLPINIKTNERGKK